mgnify:CR=1 FL=1
MLEARTVSFRVAGRAIVDGVSVAVEPGRLLAVVGPNGAGKSTLLRLLSGVDLTPTEGAIVLDESPVSAWSSRELARRRALLSQEHHLLSDFPAFEVVLMGRAPHVERRESELDFAIAGEALAQMNGAHLADQRYPTLSGGEKQRVALARAAAQIGRAHVQPSRYLLLDEPTNNLDLEHQHVALRRARAWADEGVGVLVVLHDLNLAAQYADSILVMDRGRAVATGRPFDVLTPELMRRVFRTVARVEPHPCFDCPLVVTLQAVAEPYGQTTA